MPLPTSLAHRFQFNCILSQFGLDQVQVLKSTYRTGQPYTWELEAIVSVSYDPILHDTVYDPWELETLHLYCVYVVWFYTVRSHIYIVPESETLLHLSYMILYLRTFNLWTNWLHMSRSCRERQSVLLASKQLKTRPPRWERFCGENTAAPERVKQNDLVGAGSKATYNLYGSQRWNRLLHYRLSIQLHTNHLAYLNKQK